VLAKGKHFLFLTRHPSCTHCQVQ